MLIGIVPSFNESVSDRERCGLVRSKVVEVESSQTQSILDVIHY